MAVERREETMHYSVARNFYLLGMEGGGMYVDSASSVAHRHAQRHTGTATYSVCNTPRYKQQQIHPAFDLV